MVEEHARRAMQLRNDHPLGAVDDEGAVLGHERNLAHEDFLLPHFLHLFGGGLAVVKNQAHLNPQRRGIGDAAQHAFLHIEHGLAEPVLHISKLRIAGIAFDREHRLKRGVQTYPLTLLRRFVKLEEFPVGIHLYPQQVGNLHRFRQLAEVFADALFLREAIRHSNLPRSRVAYNEEKPTPLIEVSAHVPALNSTT